MFYIMEYENQMFINKKWERIGIFKETTITENPNERIKYYTMNNFKQLQHFAEDFYGLENSKTIFGKPCIRVNVGLSFDFNITERSFKHNDTIQFRRIYKKFYPTMQWLAENLPAEAFAEYAKDRDWNNIVIIRE